MVNFIKKNKYLTILVFLINILMIFMDGNSFWYEYYDYADVNIYYEIGKAINNGKVVYQDIFDTKGFYMFFIGSLSHLLFNNFNLFFILDTCSITMFIIYFFKILDLYMSSFRSFICTFVYIILAFISFNYFGSPEMMYMGFYAYFLYCILSKKIEKLNHLEFIFFGIFAAFVLCTKPNYLMSFIFVGIYYFIINKKNYKKLMINIVDFICGLIIGLIPMFIYEIKIGKIGYLIPQFFELAITYTKDGFHFPNSYFMLFVIVIFTVLFLFKRENKIENSIKIFTILFLAGSFVGIIATKRINFYYIYTIFCFLTLAIIAINNIKNKTVSMILILVLIEMLIIFGESLDLKNNKFINKEDSAAFAFYEDYKDIIKEDDDIVCIFSIDSMLIHFFDNQPNSKYFVNLNNTYSTLPDMYNFYYNGLLNKEIEYVIVREKNGKIEINNLLVLGDNSNSEKISEILNLLIENYDCIEHYTNYNSSYAVYSLK